MRFAKENDLMIIISQEWGCQKIASPKEKILPHAPIDTTCEIERVTNTPHKQSANRTRKSVILTKEIQLIQAALMA